MRVEVIRAWPRRHDVVVLQLPAGATVAAAVTASGLVEGSETIGFAVHGERSDGARVLRDGDRVELLRPLQTDPKEARRRRARSQGRPGGGSE